MTLVKGKAPVIVLIFTGCLLWSPFLIADSLTIRFSSGKTQRVMLEEPMDAVVNIQLQTTGTEGRESEKKVHFCELYNNEIARKGSDAAEDKKATTDKKNPYHLKWGAPKLGE